jgi:hypothetical protein
MKTDPIHIEKSHKGGVHQEGAGGVLATDEHSLLHGFRQRKSNKLLVKVKTIWVNPPEFSAIGVNLY